MAGHWKQHQLWDGTYNYIDLLNINEMMLVENENRRRDYEHKKQKEAALKNG
jgi:hypothetical protein